MLGRFTFIEKDSINMMLMHFYRKQISFKPKLLPFTRHTCNLVLTETFLI